MVPADRPRILPALTQAFIGEVEAIAKALPNDRIAIQWDVCRRCWHGRTTTSPGRSTSARDIDVLTKIGDAVPPAIELPSPLLRQPGRRHGAAEGHRRHGRDGQRGFGAGAAADQLLHLPVPKGRTDDAYFAPLRH
jgi:hypothetical protein